jgi:hypothetical protein
MPGKILAKVCTSFLYEIMYEFFVRDYEIMYEFFVRDYVRVFCTSFMYEFFVRDYVRENKCRKD